MILDKRNEFFTDTAIPSGNAIVGDVIDLEGLGSVNAGRGEEGDIGNGHPLYWYVFVGASPADGTSIQLQLVTDDNPAMSSPTVVVSTSTITISEMLNNQKLVFMSLPLEGTNYERYLGVRVNVSGSFSAGTLHSGLTFDPHGWRAYPEGQN